jgi:hypothetical protein
MHLPVSCFGKLAILHTPEKRILQGRPLLTFEDDESCDRWDEGLWELIVSTEVGECVVL